MGMLKWAYVSLSAIMIITALAAPAFLYAG
jgi:hypothetical protein